MDFKTIKYPPHKLGNPTVLRETSAGAILTFLKDTHFFFLNKPIADDARSLQIAWAGQGLNGVPKLGNWFQENNMLRPDGTTFDDWTTTFLTLLELTTLTFQSLSDIDFL